MLIGVSSHKYRRDKYRPRDRARRGLGLGGRAKFGGALASGPVPRRLRYCLPSTRRCRFITNR